MNHEEIIVNTTRRVAKNTGALIAGTIISKLCLLVFLAIAARYIGPEGFGKYTFALSFAALFIVLGDMGLDMLAIREVARDRTLISKYLGNIAILKTILSAIAVGIIFLVINLLNYPLDTTKIVYIIGISVFFSSLSTALRWCFQAFQKMEYEALVNAAQGIILLGLGLAILYLGKGLIGLAFAHLLTSVIIFFFSFLITIKKFAKPKFEINFGFWKFLLKTAVPIGLMSVFVTVYFNTNTVLLSLMKGDAPAGWYNAGYKLIDAIKFIPAMLALAVFPAMSEFYKSSIETSQKVLRKSIQYVFLLALPMAIGTTILSYKIIPIIWGQEFSQAISVLQILIWVAALSFISTIIHHYLIATNQQKVPIYTIGAGLILNIFLNLTLIPKFSYLGSSIAILMAQFAIFFFVIFYIFKYLKINPFPKQTFNILMAAALMGGFTWFIKDFNLFLVVSSSALFYFFLLILLKGIQKSDLNLIKQVFSVSK